MSFSYEFNYDSSLNSSYQGQLASSYTNALNSYLQDEGADVIAFLAHTVNGLSMADADLVMQAVMNGEFTLSGLFSAAQSKDGNNLGDPSDPSPVMLVSYQVQTGVDENNDPVFETVSVTVDLTPMLGGLDSETWTTSTKKEGTVYHTREFYSESVVPQGYEGWRGGEPVNEAPTDIHLAIDAAFAASLSSGTTTGAAGATIGTLIATDPDAGDTHTFAIEGVNPGDRFVIDGDQLKLAEGKEIKEGDGTFSVTIKVTDSAGNTYYETFSFTAGGTSSQGNNTLNGNEASGDGILADPTVGDDVIFGFTGNDTLGTDITGTSGDDAIFGGDRNDLLFGGDGKDQLFGGDGNDKLHGGKGSDILSGGAGNDTFFWKTGDMEGGAVDRITDWSTGDNKLDIADLLEGFNIDSDLSDFMQVTNDGTHTTVRVDVDGGANNFVDLVVLENIVLNFADLSGKIVTE